MAQTITTVTETITDKATEVVASNTVDEQLAQILATVTSTASSAKDFLVAEIPDVVEQLLHWYFTYNLIMCIVGVSSVVLTVLLLRRTAGKNAPNSFTHDSDGAWHEDPRILWPLVPIIIESLVLAAFLNIQWLKIWIAPKLWLIEYSATLIK